MRVPIHVFLSFFCSISLFGETSTQVRGWRGIVPLHSTRNDVEQVLGPPEQKIGEYSALYRTSRETVLIQYANGLPCGIGENYSQWRVPKNTVESILITPTQPVTLSDLAIDESKYEKQQGGHRHEDINYVNKQTGETVIVFLNEIRSLSYSAGVLDADLLCPGAPKPPDVLCNGATPSRFRLYRNISLERENSLLDNFSIALRDGPNRTGYIMVYAGKRARVGEAKARAERAKEYLVKVRNLNSNQLEAIDGGYREEAEVELFIVDAGMCPPTAAPTIDPRDVKIVRTTRERAQRRS